MKQRKKGRDSRRHRLGSGELYVSLMRLMTQQRLYLDKGCSRTGVARELMTNRTYVSRALNARGMNFAQFVNAYRAEHAIGLLARPDMAAVPLEDIAELSGFSTLDQMNRYVKKSAGQSACALRTRFLEKN